VQSIDVHEGQVRFFTVSCSILATCGLAYSPDGPPSALHEDHFTPLGGGWYHLVEGF
jgi:hypothetical protein